MNTPAISVIIPVYNTEKYIAQCLEGLLNQTFKDFEVVLVNDCTPDHAMDVVEKYNNRFDKFSIIEHSENRGLMEARRSGYLNALGKYFIFLDSDDYFDSNALSSLYNSIEDKSADIVISGCREVDDNENVVKIVYPKSIGDFTANEVYSKLLNHDLNHNLAFCIFRASLFNSDLISFPHQINAEDLILFLQLVGNSNTVSSIRKVYYNYRVNISSSSRSGMTEDKLRQLVRAQNFKYDYLRSKLIPKQKLMKNIIPRVAYYYRYFGEISIFDKLNQDIKEELDLFNAFKYLTFKEKIIYFVMKKTFVCSSLIKYIYSKKP